jgi:hypothetical protein
MRRAIGALVVTTGLVVACGNTAATTGAGTSSTTASGGGANAGGTSSAGGSPSTAGSGGTGGSAFAIETHTSLDQGALVLTSNLPHLVAECRTIEGAPCVDADADGLTDAWEDLALARLRPFVRLDEAEQLVNDPSFRFGIVGRVVPVAERVVVYFMLGYQRDFGSCGFTAHNGDPERVALELEVSASGNVRVTQAYTAAHENTASDHSQLFSGAELGTLVHETDPTFGEPRWVVFSSADKHATYATVAICEGISPFPCLDEDCAPDQVVDPAPFTRLAPYVNAGEPDAPLVTDLTAFMFDGDDAWADQDFCGGLERTGCSASVREKLINNPF